MPPDTRQTETLDIGLWTLDTLFPQTGLQYLRQLPQHRKAGIFLVVCNHAKIIDRYRHRDAAAAAVDDADVAAKPVECTGFRSDRNGIRHAAADAVLVLLT